MSPSTRDGCEDCLREDTSWVHRREVRPRRLLRQLTPRRHATGRWNASGHPLIQSSEPGESWVWCYPDKLMLAQ